MDRPDDSEWSRRGVLTGLGGVGLAGGLGVAPSVQKRYSTRLVVSRPEQFSTDSFQGFFVHVGPEAAGEAEQSQLGECDFSGNWSPERLTARDATLIDRLDEDYRTASTTLYVLEGRSLMKGELFVVNQQHPCPDDYVGLSVTQTGGRIRADDIDGATGGGTTGTGPGFGLAGAAAGIAGGLAALARLRGD